MPDSRAADPHPARHPAARGGGHSLQYATFFLEDMFFGVEVLKVQEVLRYQPMTPVPLAPPALSGLINLRGQIVAAVDLRRRLGFEQRQSETPPLNVVVRSEDSAVSLLVDEIGDVLEVDPKLYEPAPENMPEQMRQMIRGVYKLPDRLLLALATERVLQFGSGD